MMRQLVPATVMVIAIGFSGAGMADSQTNGQTGKQQTGNHQAQSQSQMKQQRMHHAYRVVIGKVTDTRGVQIKGQAGDEHRLLKLNANNKTVVVDLGPMKEGAFEKLGIKQGSRIWAIGSSARINDKPVVYARYLGEVYDFTPKYQGGQKPS